LSQQHTLRLGDVLPSEEHHHTPREETQFACQEDDIGNRLQFQKEGVCVESSQSDQEVAPQYGLGVDSMHCMVFHTEFQHEAKPTNSFGEQTKGESTPVAQCPEGAQAGGWAT